MYHVVRIITAQLKYFTSKDTFWIWNPENDFSSRKMFWLKSCYAVFYQFQDIIQDWKFPEIIIKKIMVLHHFTASACCETFRVCCETFLNCSGTFSKDHGTEGGSQIRVMHLVTRLQIPGTIERPSASLGSATSYNIYMYSIWYTVSNNKYHFGTI